MIFPLFPDLGKFSEFNLKMGHNFGHKSPLRRVFHHLQNDKCTGLGHLVVRLLSNKYAWVRQYDLDLDTLSNSKIQIADAAI